jgi:hypothetical protein
VNRGLAIIALAALIGAALAAAVTLPALVVSGEDAPPAALSIAAGSKRVVVRAPALPRPRNASRLEPSNISPPASLVLPPAPAQSPSSALASATVSEGTSGTTGSVSRDALGTKAQKRAKPSKRLPPPPPTVAPPPPPPPPPAAESTTKDRGHKQEGSKGKHEEKAKSHGPKQKSHGNGHDTGGAQKEHGHGHGNNGGKDEDKGDKGHDDESHGPKR